MQIKETACKLFGAAFKTAKSLAGRVDVKATANKIKEISHKAQDKLQQSGLTDKLKSAMDTAVAEGKKACTKVQEKCHSKSAETTASETKPAETAKPEEPIKCDEAAKPAEDKPLE